MLNLIVNQSCNLVIAIVQSICLLLLFLPKTCSATSVAIVKNANRIIIAADSKGDLEIAGRSGKYQHCKIHVVMNTAFAIAGLVKNTEGYDSVEIVRQVLSTNQSLNLSAELVAKELRAPLLHALRSAHRNMNPERYVAIVAGEPLEVGMVRMENAVPTSAIVTFTATSDKNGTPTAVQAIFDYCPSKDCNANDTNYRVIGFKNAFSRYAKSTVHNINLIEDARSIIELEIKAAPDMVGPPISILEIDANGLHWRDLGGCRSQTTKVSTKRKATATQ